MYRYMEDIYYGGLQSWSPLIWSRQYKQTDYCLIVNSYHGSAKICY